MQPLRCAGLHAACCSLLLLACLLHLGNCQSRSVKYLTIAVEDIDVFNYLTSLSASSSSYREAFPYTVTTGRSLNFTYMPLRGFFEGVTSSETVQSNLTKLGASAVVSDYYISLAIATYSLGIPYFIIKKSVFSFPPPGTPNIFEIEIDNFHMSQALYDISVVYKRTTLAIVSDGTPTSSQFLVNFGGRAFSVSTVNGNSTDDGIYGVFKKYNPNSLSSGMGWILLFDEPNLPLMEKTLAQASRAGMFVHAQFFFVPSLFDKQSYLTRFYRGHVDMFTFLLTNHKLYARQQLLQPFLLDCLNHYLKAFASWVNLPTTATLLDTIVSEPSIQSPLTGPFTYNPVNHVRMGVQIDVVRTNSSRPADNMYSPAGRWQSDSTRAPPFTPDYSGADSIEESRIVFAAFEAQPYFYDYNSTANTGRGLCLQIVEAMRAQLGFEYKVISASSQDEVLKLLKNGSADVSLNFLEPTADRLDYTDASVNMVQDGSQMLIKKGVHNADFLHVFYPFSFYVWMSIVFAILLLSVTLFISDRISPNSQGKPMFTPFESFYLVLSSFLMSKAETEPKKLSTRLFTLLLWFSTLMYMTTYLSNLVAFLIQPDDEVSFTNLGDLQNSRGYKWAFVRGSQVIPDVQANWPGVYSRAAREWPSEMFLNSIQDGVTKVLSDSSFILIASADSMSFVKNQDCRLVVMGNIANSRYRTWLYRKGFKYQEQLNTQLTARKDTDFAQMRSKYFDLNRCYTGPTDIQNKEQLGFEYLCGLFALLGIGMVAGFLQLLSRWIYHRFKEWRTTQAQRVHFRRGSLYSAEVCAAKPDGLWVRIDGENEVRFMDNGCLNPNADGCENPSNVDLKGERIEVQYVGDCSISGAKIFVMQSGNGTVSTIRLPTDSDDYSEANSTREYSA